MFSEKLNDTSIPADNQVKVKKGQTLTLEIDNLAFGGRGVARVNGLAVFVDNTLPGDVVSARIFKKKKSFAEARLLEVIRPSDFRVKPECRYCGWCGGCRLRILDYDKQLMYKRRHVLEALERIALIADTPVHEVIPAVQTEGYRNKMEFSCSDRRWLLPEEMEMGEVDDGFALGLHVPGTFHKILDINTCRLFPDLGNHILEDVRRYIKASSQPVYGLRSHVGFWRFVMLRHSVANDHWLVNIVTASEDRPAVQPLADALFEKYPEVVAVVNNITSRKSSVAVGEYEINLAGQAAISDRLGRFWFDISANSFFQTNTAGAETLYRVAEKYAGLSGNETVVDLYCGIGTIGIWLSGKAREVIGLEVNDSCVADAEKNCVKNEVLNVRFVTGDVRETLAALSLPVDVMIIDPPRAGMHKDVVKQVLALAPLKIVYVSCNPATLARDLALLKDAYHVLEVQPVDMFPHTPHIESVARLVRK